MGDGSIDTAEWAESLYREHGDLVLRTCRAIVRDHHDAEDAAHEVFSKLLGRTPEPAVRDQRRWLLEVTRNHCIDRLRAGRRRGTVALTDATGAARGAVEDVGVHRDQLRWLLSLLTPSQREAMVRQAVLDQPLEDVAGAMGLSYGAAAQLFYRARLFLAQAQQQLGAAVLLLQARMSRGSRRQRQGGVRLGLHPSLAAPLATCLVMSLFTPTATHHDPMRRTPHAAPMAHAPGAPDAVRAAGAARAVSAAHVTAHLVTTTRGPSLPASSASPTPPTPPPTFDPTHPGTCLGVSGLHVCAVPSQPTTPLLHGL
jgi:RNA polymerase sigma factor (sigma-70 family)